MHIHKMGGSPLYFNALIDENKLNSDSKKFPGKMTGVKPQSLVIR